MSPEWVLEIETAVLQAWPAEQVVDVDGWRLRFARGVTGRANSVWPNSANGTLPVAAKIEQAEAFYHQHGLPVRFQLGPAAQPDILDDILAGQGYTFYSPTHVQTAVLAAVTPAAHHPVQITAAAHPDWLACHQEIGGYDVATLGVRAAIMARVTAPKAFAAVMINGRIAGIGFGVCSGSWLGLFCIESRPEFRRQGVATAVLAGLIHWGKTQQSRQAYLQVSTSNAAALALYGRLGFTTAYTYHYRRHD